MGYGCLSKPPQFGLQGRREPSMLTASLLDPPSCSGTKTEVCAQGKGKCCAEAASASGRKLGGWAKNLGPICRVKVLLDVPTKQRQSRGSLGHLTLSSKLTKTVFLFFTLDSTKKFEGPCVHLQGRETSAPACSRLERRVSAICQLPHISLHHIKHTDSVSSLPRPCFLLPLEPHPPEEATKSPQELQITKTKLAKRRPKPVFLASSEGRYPRLT